MNTVNERKRVFCCAECGLIWFDIMSFEKIITCPECNSNNLYACDTSDYFNPGYINAGKNSYNRKALYRK